MNGADSPAAPVLYRGKAKTVYGTDRPDRVLVRFRDDITAGNGQKRAEISGKGELNSRISALLFSELERAGVATHYVADGGPAALLCRLVQILPLEVVVRNRAAGSLSARLGLPEGEVLPEPIVEFYYKRDDLGDPLVNRDHIRILGIASDAVLERIEAIARRANEVLAERFARAGLTLVDIKLEFGLAGDELLVADEISPDTMRVWDADSGERLDKDRFRRDLGGVREGYETILRRLEGTVSSVAVFTVCVRVFPKEGMLDPQGRAVRDGLHTLGFPGVRDVRVGKAIRLDVVAPSAAAARDQAEDMARRVLANPVIEQFTVEAVLPQGGSR